jgi:hypothetical protein
VDIIRSHADPPRKGSLERRVTQLPAFVDLAPRRQAASEDPLKARLEVLLGQLSGELDSLACALLGLVEVPEVHIEPTRSEQRERKRI